MAKIELSKDKTSTVIPGPVSPRKRGLLVAVLVSLAVFSLFAFALLAWYLRSNGWSSPIDLSIVQGLRTLHNPWLTNLMWVTSLPGDPSVITPLTALSAIVLIIWGLRPGAVFLVTTMLSEAGLRNLFATNLARPRPPVAFSLISQPITYSFPSGHTWATFLFVAVLGLVLWRTLPKHWSVRVTIVSVATAIAMLVGASRVYLGVHWPSDVLGAWILAIFTFVTVSAIYLAIVKKYKFKERDLPLGPLWFRITSTLVCLAIVLFLIYHEAGLNPLIVGRI